MSENIGCKYCKHYIKTNERYFHNCFRKKETDYVGDPIYERCVEINQNKQCADFEMSKGIKSYLNLANQISEGLK